jgi:hypothetical protein
MIRSVMRAEGLQYHAPQQSDRQELTGAEEIRERFTEEQNRLKHIDTHMSERCGRVVARPM